MDKILITGATGFVGRNLMDVLTALAQPVMLYALVRDLQKARPLLELSRPVSLLQGNLENPETLRDLPADLTWVFHVASRVGLRNGPEFYPANVGGTKNLLAALKSQQHLKRLVYISSITAVDRPPDSKPPYPPLTELDTAHPRSDYGKSKYQAEQLIMESGLPYTILRPAYIYGPYPRKGSTVDRVIYDVLQGNPYTRFPYTGHASEIYAGDLAEIMWACAREPRCENQIYFVANPHPVGVAYYFKTLHTLLNRPYHPYPIPRLLMPWLKRTMVKEGLDPVLGEILFHDYFVCDPSKLYRDISYRPYYGFEGGLTRTVQWYREQDLLPAPGSPIR